ncbi:MAG: hypothetical protein KJ070_16985 [Verrucomicrobia bacterium]|nr:hypothetical protein [Verrucomicrobiota bacterium]
MNGRAKLFLAGFCLALICTHARATVTINLDAADLRTADGQLMPLGGQVLLVASTNDATFGGPTPAAFASGGDVVLLRRSLDSGQPGYFQAGVNLDFAAFPGLKPGDPIQLYWFPTLTAGDASPGEGTSFGFYRHATGVDGSAPWVIPGDGAVVSVNFITVSQGGSNPNELGYANRFIARPVILSLTGAGTPNVVITWSAASNQTYRVQHRPDLNSGWSDLSPDITATNTTASMVDSSAGVNQRYYRVMIVP